MNGGKCTDARIVLGAAAPVPWRVKPAELVLKDKHIDKAVAREAAATAVQGAEPLELNGYKVQIFKTVVYRTICWALDLDPLKD
jgi:xanthine dehydrogenase YagS FAD-binding subunit